MKNNKLFEGLEQNDLKNTISNKFSIDEFKSKMGDDADIIVVSFVAKDKSPAQDLMNFIEKGYDWVLDGDISAGESSSGEWSVFVELQRAKDAAEQICQLTSDISNLTDIDDWRFKYRKNLKYYDCSEENIRGAVPLTPEAYSRRYDTDELDKMMETARVNLKRTAPVNDFTDSLRVAAGLK